MAAFSSCCVKPPPPTIRPNRLPCPRCSSRTPDNKKAAASGTGTPQILKVVVSGATELLRLFSSSSSTYNKNRVSDEKREEILVSGVDDVVKILQSDYENSYFVTGAFTSAIYAEDCIFEDPTIRFEGTELYSRNLKLLVPFFDHPSIGLQKIEKGMNSKTDFVLATWKLRLLGMLRVGMFLHSKQLARYSPLVLEGPVLECSRLNKCEGVKDSDDTASAVASY